MGTVMTGCAPVERALCVFLVGVRARRRSSQICSPEVGVKRGFSGGFIPLSLCRVTLALAPRVYIDGLRRHHYFSLTARIALVGTNVCF